MACLQAGCIGCRAACSLPHLFGVAGLGLKGSVALGDLIVVSNAAREFIEMEIMEAGIQAYFTRIFSVTSDFGQVKKTPECYEEVLKAVGVAPTDTVHVGDHYEFDYLIPKQLGIESYFLDRDGNRPKDRYTVKDLTEFANLVNNP